MTAQDCTFPRPSGSMPSGPQVSAPPVGPAVASPAPSSNTIGLSGSQGNSSSFSQSSKCNKSHDWSLSDTDLKELLERGSPLHLATPCALNLVAVPETREFAAPVKPLEPGSALSSSMSSPSQSCSAAGGPHSLSGSSPLRSWPAKAFPALHHLEVLHPKYQPCKALHCLAWPALALLEAKLLIGVWPHRAPKWFIFWVTRPQMFAALPHEAFPEMMS